MNNQKSVYQAAMFYGLILGAFYILKFPLLIVGLKNPTLEFVFILLTLSVPFITWRMTRLYRDVNCSEPFTFIRAWAFGLYTYLFASIIAAIAHFVYFRYIDGGFIIETYRLSMQPLNDVEGGAALLNRINLLLDAFEKMTAAEITTQLLLQNIFYGSIIALLTAAFIRKRQNNL